MNPLYFNTPFIYSLPLSSLIEKDIYLKMECFQPSGSFKNRGIGTLIQYFHNEGIKGIVAASGGNAGLAAAYAARQYNMHATVVVPKKARHFMVEKIRNEGAEVILYGEGFHESKAMAMDIVKQNGFAYVSPFDHPEIWKGHASMIQEIAETKVKPDAVVLSVGGGGLMNGVVYGLQNAGWKDVPVITVEPEGAAALAKSIKADEIVTLDHVESVATSLCSPYISEETFRLTKEHSILPQVVSDEDCLEACVRFADDHRVLVEPACGAALAPVYKKLSVLRDFKEIAVIVCGGNLVNCDLIREWQD